MILQLSSLQSLLGSTNINPNEGEGLLQSLMDTKADWGQLSQAVINKERKRFLSDAIRFMYFRSTSPEPSDKTAKEGQPSDKLQRHKRKILECISGSAKSLPAQCDGRLFQTRNV